MTARGARPVAWGLWAASVAAVVAGIVLSTLYPFSSVQEVHDPVGEAIWAFSWLGFGLVGAMIVSQKPDNRIGWVLVGITFTIAITMLTPSYARAALFGPDLPLGGVAAWLGTWMFYPASGMVVALLLLYPRGVLSRPRHKAAAIALGVAVAGRSVVGALTPGPIEGDGPPLNPLGRAEWESGLLNAGDVLSLGMVVVAVLVLGDFIVRFRRSQGLERLQFRWLAWAAAAFPVLFLIAMSLEEALLDANSLDPVVVIFFVCGNGLAAAIGVAITRHGLYEINRVLSRTVSYALLTAVLVAVYLAAVTLLTTVIAPVAGDSPIAVAAATLLAAAAFGPARRRIQDTVDRRFNRARYDASLTVAAYRGRLRDEVDLETVASGLIDTVLASMQPAATNLWLAGGGSPREMFTQPTAVTVSERLREKKGSS